MDLLSPRVLALLAAAWVVVALVILALWWGLDDVDEFGGDTIDDPTLADAHFIYCSVCGFYPSDTDERVGVRSETHAENLAALHRRSNPGHETYLVPGEWVSDTADTYVQKKFR